MNAKIRLTINVPGRAPLVRDVPVDKSLLADVLRADPRRRNMVNPSRLALAGDLAGALAKAFEEAAG